MARNRELTRTPSGSGRMIAGVASGVADYLGLSRTLVRIGFAVFGLIGAGEIAYIILWIVMPKG